MQSRRTSSLTQDSTAANGLLGRVSRGSTIRELDEYVRVFEESPESKGAKANPDRLTRVDRFPEGNLPAEVRGSGFWDASSGLTAALE